ncbi:MAG: Hpt domain-containing protein [Treponema sp.]|nr:Hpt domain-containing protein [Treponema sp.]
MMADDVIYIDMPDGVKRVMGNEKLYVRLLTKFRDGTNLSEIEAAFAEGNMEKAQNATHTVKGVAANLSLSELFKQCLALESQIKARVLDTARMETVKTVFAATISEVNKVIADHV